MQEPTRNDDHEWSKTLAKIHEKKHKKDVIGGVKDQLEAIRSNKVGFVSQVAAGTDEAKYQTNKS